MLSLWGKKKIEFPVPEIIRLEEPIKIVGLAIQTGTKTVYKDVPELGKKFHSLKKSKGLKHRKMPWGFAAVTKDFDQKQGTWTYIIGDVVTSLKDQPAEFVTFEIPAGTYAVFTVRPKNRLVWGWTITQVKNYAYTQWLPGSDYTAAGDIDDFEYNDERSMRLRDAEIDLYISVRPREESSI